MNCPHCGSDNILHHTSGGIYFYMGEVIDTIEEHSTCMECFKDISDVGIEEVNYESEGH
jgi:hypothetical protein